MGPSNGQNRIRNLIVEAVNAEKQLWLLIQSKGPLDIDVQNFYRKARSSYEEIVLSDHELSELQDIEYSLWKLHYKHIDEYRNRIRQTPSHKKSTNVVLDDLLKGLKSFLSEATEFYQDFIAKIRISYGLPKELSVLNDGSPFGSMESSEIRTCQFSCHRSSIFLGDLARYGELYGTPDAESRNWSFAASHYFNALMIWPDSGNPQNQLAVLATYLGDDFLAFYHCIRSIAVKEPFPDAWDNLSLLFEKNKSICLHSLSKELAFDFSKPSERVYVQNANDGVRSSDEIGLWSLTVQMISFFYRKSSLEEFPFLFGSTIIKLEALIALDDVSLNDALESYRQLVVSRTGPFRALQLVSILIFTIHTLNENPKLEKPSHLKYEKEPALIQLAWASTFICMGRLLERCAIFIPLDQGPLLPAILVFLEWLVEMLDKLATDEPDERCEIAMGYFFGSLVTLLNQLDDQLCEIKSRDLTAIWEDHELRGFIPVSPSHGRLDFSTPKQPRPRFEDSHECQIRISRILHATMKIVNMSNGSRKWIFHGKHERKFYLAESKEYQYRRESEATDDGVELKKEEGNLDDNHLSKLSSPVEEEEVILFKPIVRHNSAPLYTPGVASNLLASSAQSLYRNSSLLPQNQIPCDISDVCSIITSSHSKKISWKEPLTEESVATNSYTEQSTESPSFEVTDGISSITGPPSLSGWVLEKENFGITEKGKNDSNKYGTLSSINETAENELDMKVQPSSSSSQFMHGFSSQGDYIGALSASSTTHYAPPPYILPLPSAPLLPDNANWSSSDSSSYSENKDSEDMKEQFFDLSQANLHSNLMETRQNFSPSIPKYSYVDSTPRPHYYQGHPNLVHAQENVFPVQFNSPTNLRRFHDEDISRLSLFDRWANLKEQLQDPQWRPGFYEQVPRDKISHGQQRFDPYRYGAAMDLRSEQHWLLQYLKEKERRLQLESKLRENSQM